MSVRNIEFSIGRICLLIIFVVITLVACSSNSSEESSFVSTGQNSISSGSIGSDSSSIPSDGSKSPASSTDTKSSSISTSSSSNSSTPRQDDPLNSSSQTVKNSIDTSNGTGTELVWRRKYYFSSELYDSCVFPSAIKSKKVKTGSEVHELFYIRSKIEENSFLNKQIIDSNPYDYVRSPKNYSQHLKNMTGADSYYDKLLRSAHSVKELKDSKYLHSISESEFINYKNIQRNASFGINWKITQNDTKIDVFVRYIDPANSDSYNKGIRRGDKLIQVGDVRIDEVNDSSSKGKLYENLFPPTPRVDSWPTRDYGSTNFVFLDGKSGKEKKVVLEAFRFSSENYMKFGNLELDNQNIAYLALANLRPDYKEEAGISDKVYSLFLNKFTQSNNKVSDLVLDLRYTKFGSIVYASQLAYLITGEVPTTSKKFGTYFHASNNNLEKSFHKDIVPFLDSCKRLYPCSWWQIVSVDWWIWHFVFWQGMNPNAEPYTSKLKPVLNLDRVFILTSEETCGIAEILINSLLGIDFEVILVGTGTCGRPYYGSYYGSCGIKYFIPEFRFLNNKKFGDYFDGFKPENSPIDKGISVKGCYVEDDLSQNLGSKDENLLGAALQYRKNGTCPTLPKNVNTLESNRMFPMVW